MFAGVDKLGGGVVGDVIANSSAKVISMGESAATASAEETLVGRTTSEDGTSTEVLMKSRVDPGSGGLCWLPVDAAVAAADTTSMSQMTSMLHDDDRNRKYEAAITDAVQTFINEHGRPPLVLDIGCGTGLLSMLAVRAGATEVYGCELYEPLAVIAREVTELNCTGKIKIIGKRSTELVVGGGEGADLPRRADICINEIYDSGLLGEGCLPALRHALADLLMDAPVMVPASAGIHGVLLSSTSLRVRHDLSTAEFSEGVPVARNARAAECKGGRKPWPLQQAEVLDAVELSETVHLLSFDFSEPFPEEGCRSRTVSVRAERDGTLDAVMMTWDLALRGNVTYSTRPGAENWQDHWCPCYFPLVGNIRVLAGDTVRLKVTHSELNIMVEVLGVEAGTRKGGNSTAANHHRAGEDDGDGAVLATTAKRARSPSLQDRRAPGHTALKKSDAEENGGEGSVTLGSAEGYRMEREWDPEPCGCGWHVLCNPERIGMLRDEERRDTFRLAIVRLLHDVLNNTVGDQSAVCLDIGDGAICAFLAAGAGAGTVVSYEPAEWSHLLVGQVVRNNDLEEKVHLLESADEWPFLKEALAGPGTVFEEGEGEANQEHLLCDALVGEPFYYRMQSLVLYQAMNFWYLRRLFNPVLKSTARVLPMRAIICVAGVELPDLSLSHGPVGSVLGFDHAPYDERVRSRWHQLLYPYPLGAYKHRLVTDEKDLLSFDYNSLPTDVESTRMLMPTQAGTVHAVAIWVDYQLDETSRWSTFGGARDREVDTLAASVDGDRRRGGGHYHKQMLRFLSKPIEVSPHRNRNHDRDGGALTVSGRFDADSGCMTFDVV